MTEPEDLEEDLFADLYDGDDANTSSNAAAPTTAIPPEPIPAQQAPINNIAPPEPQPMEVPVDSELPPLGGGDDQAMNDDDQDDGVENWVTEQSNDVGQPNTQQQEPFGGIREDGKMFIGGLNWETTDQSLRDYFSQYGEVQECTVMRDGASGRSRGFGFLTFKDPKCVNTVMVKEHFLDGKIIDPKRAIPRDEQERTSKIFVGGVSQEATEQDFKGFFMQFGRVVDATLMMDKDTGRPRGFGFVTFDSEAAVEACLAGDLQILGKPIEVKKAQPRGNMKDEDEGPRGRGGRRGGKEFNNQSNDNNAMQQQAQNGPGAGMASGMTPQMMAQYWARMQQYFQMMQQQMAAAAMAQGQAANMNAMGMGNMNPAMMQQMMQMQQMQQQMGRPNSNPQSPGPQGMNPAMMQQMMQMQQQQQQQQGQSGIAGANRPGYTAQEQLAFEQQKYEAQQARRSHSQSSFNNFGGGPTSWEGMYDDVPQPNMNQGGVGGRGGGNIGRNMTPNGFKAPKGPAAGAAAGAASPPNQPSNAPVNAPTGPKNAGKPGANYRGGGRGGRFHPYAR